MDSAKYQGVVGQRIMSCAVTGKGSMSNVSPGLSWWHEKIYKICNIILITKLACRNDGGGRSRCCVLVASTDFCRMRGIEADCSRLKPRARGEYLTSQLSWAAAWLLVTYGSPLHLVVDELLRPCVLCSLMIKLSGSLDVFLTWWVWFYL